MQPFQGLSSKMDDKTLRKEIISTLDSNIRIETYSVALEDAGFAGSALQSLTSALDLQCGEQLGAISRAPEPCFICAVLKSAKSFHAGLFPFSQFQGSNILE